MALATLCLYMSLDIYKCIMVSASTDSYSNYFDRPVYQSVTAFACVTILNGTSMTGCGGSSTGILYGIDTDEQMEIFISMKKHSIDYTIVTSHSFINPVNLKRMSATGRLAGVIVLADETIFPVLAAYSPDSKCPNCQYGIYGNATSGSIEEKYLNHEWNTHGNGLLDEYFDFPIFLIPANKAILDLKNVATAVANNLRNEYSKYPLFSAEFDSKMWATKDSVTCLRRGWCTPLGGTSVWSSFSSNIRPDDGKDIIFLSTRLDSKAFFSEFAVGTSSIIPSIVSALGVAHALWDSAIDFNSLNKHIVLSFFDMETYGFSGSKRFVKDILENIKCKQVAINGTDSCKVYSADCVNPCFPSMDFQNLSFDKISTILEYDSLGMISSNDDPTYFLHSYHDDSEAAKVLFDYSVNSMDSANIKYARSSSEFGIPPSSSMSFLAKNALIDAVIISDFNTSYSQPYYNSIFDGPIPSQSALLQSICNLATVTVKSMLKMAGADNDMIEQATANCPYISELYSCLAHDLSCDLLYSVYPRLLTQNIQKVGSYSGAFQYSAGTFAHLVKQLLAKFTTVDIREDINCYNDAGCDLGYTCVDYMPAYVSDAEPILEESNTDPLDNFDLGQLFQTPDDVESDTYTSFDPTEILDFNVTTPVGHCVKGLSRYHWSYSAGIEMNYITGNFVVSDPKRGAWTESIWENTRIRIFPVQSIKYQVMQFFVGVIFTILAIVTTKLFQKHHTRILAKFA